jgi:hypothetical protein
LDYGHRKSLAEGVLLSPEDFEGLGWKRQEGELSAENVSIIQKTLLSLEGLRLQPGDAVQVLESAGKRLYDLLGAVFDRETCPVTVISLN